MGTYHKWYKSSIQWEKTSISIPSIVKCDPYRLFEADLSGTGSTWGEPQVDPNTGKFVGNWRRSSNYDQFDRMYVNHGRTIALKENPSECFHASFGTSGEAHYIYRESDGISFGNGVWIGYKAKAKQGSFQEYVYSTSPGTYPNYGEQGGSWYAWQGTVQSPTPVSHLTYPSTILHQSVGISWPAATSNTNYSVTGYEISYAVNGGNDWVVAGSPTNTNFTATIPPNTNTICFRVRAKDSYGQWGEYTQGSWANVLSPPSLTVPLQGMTGQPIPISWSSVTQATSYKLERKANTDSSWSQIYSGAELSYSDTAGKWTSVQYRVAAMVGGSYGEYSTGPAIPIVSESVLSISGSDSDLGTLVSDVPYSISTDTGKPITGTITINGLLVFSGTVDSGTPQAISILDIPTGAEKGTITIKATVQAGSGPVTATRIWTYTKTPIRYTGGRCDIIQCEGKEGAKQYPMTVAEAVRLPGGLTLDQLYQMLVKKGVIP